MRYEHYKRVVKWERRRRYPERKHERERPGVKKIEKSLKMDIKVNMCIGGVKR